eukprot:CAMPEP_0119414274 /NCGR_PEP_ID=MMETSP1335-20130426/6744_1 /TAXON_ID=259385 /ORGANISM="Chrysoculter rhomboideus, Strain RCC1486" /LENGTH=424 /DNA_ID=CAMNT_0007439143 /DNA_START=89 /DNA_END=1363 /DNA_ORIENTATION=+
MERPADKYSPTYFLASLGMGGIAVTFFMYPLFWVPHPGRTVPIFEDIVAAWVKGDASLQAAIVISMAGILSFAVLNLYTLAWNLRSYAAFKKSDAYAKLRQSHAESTLLAMPLTLAMSVNVVFIVGIVFIPRIWTVIEYLFPIAMTAFALITVHAFYLLSHFLGRVLTKGDEAPHNTFAQVTPAFAIAMIAVGFAAPAAMSSNPSTVGASIVFSTALGTFAIVYAVFAAISALSSMLKHGTSKESAPTLMIIIPICTVLGIMFMRQDHGLHYTYDAHTNAGETLVFLARMLSIQLAFLFLGGVVIFAHGYLDDFVFGSKTSAGSYALVCPFVALSVMLHFFVNKGLVAAGVIAKYDPAYWFVTSIALLSQAIAIALVIRLNMQHFTPRQVQTAATKPAEDIEAAPELDESRDGDATDIAQGLSG